MQKSKRSIILEQVVALYEAVRETLPNDDPYPFTFTQVELGPLVLTDFNKRFSIGIVVGDETKTDTFPFKNAVLPIAIEFKRVKQMNEGKASVLAEEMLTAVQRVIYSSEQLGLPDIVIDVKETGNTVDLDSFQDKAVAGVLFLEVQYRHSRHDVRN